MDEATAIFISCVLAERAKGGARRITPRDIAAHAAWRREKGLRLHAEGWSYGIAQHFTKHGLLFCVDAHRDGKRFIVKADDLLTAFFSLERDAIAPKGANSKGT